MELNLVLNKNFHNFLGFMLFGGLYQTTTAAQIGTNYAVGKGLASEGYFATFPCPVTDTAGNVRAGIYVGSYNNNPLVYNNTFFNFNNGSGLYFPHFTAGSGSTAATINDTALTTPNTNITATISLGMRDTATSMIYTVTFSSATEQTLREIGLERQLYVSNNTYAPVLFGRAVFDEDITLDANTPKTVQIRLALPALE